MAPKLTNLVLERPLAVLDLETTGTDARNDRIVEICVLKLLPDGTQEQRERRINPGQPIPPEATAVHKITDADVADKPTFDQIARSLLTFLADCDLCGFNLRKFDLQVLRAEFARASIDFPLEGRAIVDPMEIFHHYERRDLSAAVRFYCGREHEGAHSASADVLATADILEAMLGRYSDLPRNVPEIFRKFRSAQVVDADGKFTRVDGDIRFAFGKYRGVSLADVARQAPDYLTWMLDGDFSDEVKAVLREHLAKPESSASSDARQSLEEPRSQAGAWERE